MMAEMTEKQVYPSGRPITCDCKECRKKLEAAWSHHYIKQEFPEPEFDWEYLEKMDKLSRMKK